MITAFVGLGSNLGNRLEWIRFGIGFLERHPRITIVSRSGIYQSAPFHSVGQDYFNAVLQIETNLSSELLLQVCHEAENQAGRPVHRKKNESRTLDMDILYFGEQQTKSDILHIPHPNRLERAFVVEPLLEIAPNFRDFEQGVLIKDLRLNNICQRISNA